MSYSFEYIDIILLAMIAGFIFLRLRGILGKKSGFEEDITQSFPHEFPNVNPVKKTNFDDWDKDLYLDGHKNLTMKKVELIDENLACLSKGEYSNVKDDMFRDVLQTVVDCPFMPFIENSTMHVTYYK